MQAFQSLRTEWRVAAHDHVEDHSASPEITFLRVISFNYFWRHVVRGPEKFGESLVRFNAAGDPEIDQFNIDTFVSIVFTLTRLNHIFNQNVFYFEVTVHDTSGVAVIYS